MKRKKITPLQRVFGYFMSFLAIIHAYQSWVDGRKISFFLYGLGGLLLILMYSNSFAVKERE
ncbi:hypothetical protein [Rossellomorea sp. YZS02]|uniref:hypothetical protein n=1 Tax=Rossellomorea sp. YZS02 TaxID=3097358 RepID=UPI002A11564F|nr:hypothetical protein [Rossellomorea sp. YZS02]MDX8344614.1 hypothetical protein [Rossellomorea sp. YZS02]